MWFLRSRRRIADWYWQRHRHPASGWTRILVGIGLAISVWFQQIPWIVAFAVAALTNPIWFPPPRNAMSVMTRAVDGERLWLQLAPWSTLAVLVTSALFLTAGLGVALWRRETLGALVLGGLVVFMKLAFTGYVSHIAKRTPYDHRTGPGPRRPPAV